MGYVAIPRKYRPQKFKEVTGQEFITETLKNAIKNDRVAHAYIFAGPRGVGKTSTARIVAKALNCENPKDGEPCNRCPQCMEINKGSHPDVIEIDAATNRGIDQIRESREAVYYAPSKGKRKIYIIDEFHMLTKEAFNALLKTLEEPPEHVVFILATTELDKIPPTILSRCQRFVFKKIPNPLMVKTLKKICEKENVEFEEEALKLIATASEGCMRDAESLLDQAIAFGNGKVELEKVSQFLGVLTTKDLIDLLKTSFEGSKEKLRKAIKSLEERGYNPVFILKQLIETVEKEFLSNENFSEEEMEAAFQILSETYKEVTVHPYPYSVLLFHLFRLSYFKQVKKLEELITGNIQLTPKEEKKTFLRQYIKETKDEGIFIKIIPKNSVSYEILKNRLNELKNFFGKDVKLEEVKSQNLKPKKKEISKESNDKINKLIDLFGAKILKLEPLEDEGFSDR